MIIVTTDKIPEYEITEVIGLVRGNTIRARAIGNDILAIFRNMMAESREQAIDRMVDEAENSRANAIVGVRFTTNSVMKGAAELLVYGTAVKVQKCKDFKG